MFNGKARIAQRFATDWTRIGADGLAFRGDPAKNVNWSAYGKEALAVANATVVDVNDGIPENDPTSNNKAVPITLETAPGNYIILDLGSGRFAFYAHLQPKGIRVKVGDKVRRGQVLALLGNSGNSDAPHLHFHVTDGNSPLGAEGLPYVIESFEMEDILPSKGLLVEGGWKPQPSATRQRVDHIWPHLDERARRMFAANEAREIGYGGVTTVSRACGLSRVTITKALQELDAAPLAPGRVRRPGAGRPALLTLDPELPPEA